MKKEILVIDGYNMIGAWPELVKLKNKDLIEEARDRLLETLSNYRNFEDTEVIVVFDAQFVPGITKEYRKYNVTVVFTKQGETADTYIEGIVEDLQNVITDVTVATSDLAVQQLIFAKGASRTSANDLYKEIKRSMRALQQETHNFGHFLHKKRATWSEEQIDVLKDLRDELD